MAKPNNSLTDGRGRRYLFPLPSKENPKPKEKMPSVTTILGVKSKPALYSWYARQTAEEAEAKQQAAIETIKAVLRENSNNQALSDWERKSLWEKVEHRLDLAGLTMDKESLAYAPQAALVKAGRVGTAVHHYIQKRWVEGMPMEKVMEEMKGTEAFATLVDEHRDPWLKPLHEFFEEHVDEVLYGERSVYCQEHWFAGTPDMIARMKSGKTAIIDWKTGRGVYSEVALQINAYSLAEWVEPDAVKFDAKGEPELWEDSLDKMPKVDYGLCVHLRGNYTLDVYKFQFSDRMKSFFLSLNEVYKHNLYYNRKSNPWWDEVYQLTTEEGAAQ